MHSCLWVEVLSSEESMDLTLWSTIDIFEFLDLEGEAEILMILSIPTHWCLALCLHTSASHVQLCAIYTQNMTEPLEAESGNETPTLWRQYSASRILRQISLFRGNDVDEAGHGNCTHRERWKMDVVRQDGCSAAVRLLSVGSSGISRSESLEFRRVRRQ